MTNKIAGERLARPMPLALPMRVRHWLTAAAKAQVVPWPLSQILAQHLAAADLARNLGTLLREEADQFTSLGPC